MAHLSPDVLEATQARLRSHLDHIVRERDPDFAAAGHFAVREYIRDILAQWGPVETHEFDYYGSVHQNLVLKLPGTAECAPVLLGAHYDAVAGCPGADDNGTGVAALLELAQQFAHQPAQYPMWFVAFDLEEYGMLGSEAYAASLKAVGQPLRLMVSLEMLGYADSTPGSQQYPSAVLERFYPDQGDFITLVGNVLTLGEMRSLSRTIRKSGVPAEWLPAGLRGHIVPATRLSDHSPFWDQGYKAMMVTDTAFLRNPHYHQKSDRIDTLDMDFFTRVCCGLEAGIRQL
ncbi:MAG: M28 family peptidase [Leptolyngbyaceae cyanobacterium]